MLKVVSMTIILPQPPPEFVWIHPPTWLFSSYHWLYFLAMGALLIVVATMAHRSQKSFPSGLLIVLSIAPLAIGFVGGTGSLWFANNPTPPANNSAWSPVETEYHSFKIRSSALPNTFTAPKRDIAAETRYVNESAAKKAGITALKPQNMPQFTKSSDNNVRVASAKQSQPFLLDDKVFTCAFVADIINKDSAGHITLAHVTTVVCNQGATTILIAID